MLILSKARKPGRQPHSSSGQRSTEGFLRANALHVARAGTLQSASTTGLGAPWGPIYPTGPNLRCDKGSKDTPDRHNRAYNPPQFSFLG